MIGIDTNVLVRYIVQDDPAQAKVATHYIERNCTADSPGFINRIVLCEIVWILKRAYGYDKSIILNVIRQILLTAEFVTENSDVMWKALKEYESGQADFSDYIIGSSNLENGCECTVTFDKSVSANMDFILLK
jgi:predicted nucleic-acid-binding protein